MIGRAGVLAGRESHGLDAYCPACNQGIAAFRPGGHRGQRKRAKCPNCGALERHRFLALLLDGLAPLVVQTGSVLDIAPSRYVTGRIAQMAPGRYVRIDLEPEADSRDVDVQASLTSLPFPDHTFDLIICFHVLEHIPDDAAAMRELARALAPGGLIVAQVPYRRNEATEEDPTAPADERIRRFGQEDHVRRYGYDFEQRLSAAGLVGVRIEARDVVGEEGSHHFGIQPNAIMWLLRGAEHTKISGVEPRVGHPSRTIIDLTSMLLHQKDENVRLQADLERTRQEASSHRVAYERIRHHPVITVAVTVSRPLRRAWRGSRRRLRR